MKKISSIRGLKISKLTGEVIIINGNFSTPTIGTNGYSSGSVGLITGWNISTIPSGTSVYISNGLTPFSSTTPPQTQYTTVQLGATPTNITYTESISIPTGTYTVSFYACARPNYGIALLTSSFNGSSINTSGLTQANGWELNSFTTSITTTGNFDLVFTASGTTDNFISFTGITLVPSTLMMWYKFETGDSTNGTNLKNYATGDYLATCSTTGMLSTTSYAVGSSSLYMNGSSWVALNSTDTRVNNFSNTQSHSYSIWFKCTSETEPL